MLGYRLYFLNGGQTSTRATFSADDDLAAIEIARSWRETRPMELWRQDHRIHRWEAPRSLHQRPRPSLNAGI